MWLLQQLKKLFLWLVSGQKVQAQITETSNNMKHFIKHSDTCGCKYLQTFDGTVWGSEETYTGPDGRVHTSVRCAVHADIPFTNLDAILKDKECRGRNLASASLKNNPKLSHLELQDLMARATFTGPGDDRTIEFSLPELTRKEKETELTKLSAEYKVILN